MERVGCPLGVMRRVDPRHAWRGQSMTCDLSGAVLAGVGHDQLVTRDPDPDPLAGQGVRDAVPRRAESQRRVVVDEAGDPEGDGVSLGRDRVEPPPLGRQPLCWWLAGLAVLALVDRLAEGLAGRPQLGERLVRLEEVRLGGHEIGLGDPDGRLRATL